MVIQRGNPWTEPGLQAIRAFRHWGNRNSKSNSMHDFFEEIVARENGVLGAVSVLTLPRRWLKGGLQGFSGDTLVSP
jgi:hypothetical protein